MVMGYTWKFDSEGNEIFSGSYSGMTSPGGNNVVVDKDDNVFFVLRTYENGVIKRLNTSDGSIVWTSPDTSTIGNETGEGAEYARSLLVDKDNNLYAVKEHEILKINKSDGSLDSVVTGAISADLHPDYDAERSTIPSACNPGHRSIITG